MLKRYTLVLTTFLIPFSLMAQFETVVYDYSKNWFGENEDLPAEQRWLVKGDLPEGVKRVELQIYRPANRGDRFLYSSDFQRSADAEEQRQFSIPVNFKLRGSTQYNLKMLYFVEASDEDMVRLNRMVNEALTAYLNQSVVAGRRQVSLVKHPRLMIQELDQIVMDGLDLYRNRMGVEFTGFSDIVYDKLERIDDLKLKAARFNVLREPDQNEKQTRVAYFQKNIDELAQLLEREVQQYLSGNFFVLREARSINNYKTQSTRWTLPVNVGYAAVIDPNSGSDFHVDGAPMLGISFPLGNPNFSGSFWSNSSLSFGALLQNVSLNDDVSYGGPLLDTPLYFAYGYKTAYFLRIHAGTTVMQAAGSNDVSLAPFVGLSVELNLWLGLSR